jgi:hypothetical protein
MGHIVDKYRSEILLAVFGELWHEGKVTDLHRLNQYAERLAECERAHEILLALGYGKSWDSIVELAASVPHSTTMLIRPSKKVQRG